MKFFKNILLFTASTAIALVCAEFVARASGYKPFGYIPPTEWQLQILTGDSEFGWKTKPGEYRHFLMPDNGYPITITVSADGARVSAGRGPNVPTIELHGGSIGFGWGVTDGETVGDAVAQLTGQRVVNRSVGAYGSLQVLQTLKRVAQDWTESTKPAAIVYLQATHHMNRSAADPDWLLSNEIYNPRGGMMIGIPSARFNERNELVIKPAERYGAFPLRERSALVNLAEQAWVRFSRGVSNVEMIKIQAEIIRRMATLAGKNGIPFIVAGVYSQESDFNALRAAVGAAPLTWAFCMHPGYPDKKFAVPNDGHPNGIVHRYYGECVAKTLAGTLPNHAVN